jgi:predicted metal-dependent hydrolase
VIERSEIQFGTTPIPFLIRRSQQRQTVALTVENDGKLIVTAPDGVSVDRLNQVVRTKAPWVVQRIRRASDRPPPPSEREFVSGETVLYLGRQFRLKVVEAISGEECNRIWAGWYHVSVPPRLKPKAKRTEVRRRLAGSLKEHADLYLPDRLAEICRRLHLEKPSTIVREQKKRWGSCDAKGVLRLNWRIIQAPSALIDYVLVHELTHVTHPKHGREFWAALGRVMPDYERRRAQLRELGPRLEW